MKVGVGPRASAVGAPSRGRLAVAMLLAALGLPGVAAATAGEAKSLAFDKVFSDVGEPARVHFEASYQAKGAAHVMSVWREGRMRLRRSTDDKIETFVTRAKSGVDYDMVVLDKPRKIATRISRDNLYRVGNFTDWFDLAHGLRHPKGPYTLTKAAAPQAPAASALVPAPVAPCTWYALEQQGHAVRVCWSASARLPMVMVDEAGTTLWHVTLVDRQAIPPSVFVVHDEDYVRNDANADMDRD